ncbi:type I toxin-antitoxin system SymE family toxin [Escherichia albertii]|uniref:SymE family type I addiction module toxin n=1 Tax=Escherichia albertii TaxID=208962 RepID=UPI00223BADE4|nr:type I toxin-antitoxin system SymE family toxin [Escherichia albertii]
MSKTQRHYQMGYVSARHQNSKTGMTTYYSRSPSLHLKGDWLAGAGFDTGTGVTVKISEGCLILIADSNKVQELREQLYQVKQSVRGIKKGVVSALNEC